MGESKEAQDDTTPASASTAAAAAPGGKSSSQCLTPQQRVFTALVASDSAVSRVHKCVYALFLVVLLCCLMTCLFFLT